MRGDTSLEQFPRLRRSRLRWTLEPRDKEHLSRVARERNGGGKACPRCGNTDHTSANCLHFDKTFRKSGKVGHVANACRLMEQHNRRQTEPARRARGGNSAGTVKTCWNCGKNGHMSSQCPKRKVHAVEELTTASQAGSLGSVSEGIPEPRGAGAEMWCVGVPSVRSHRSLLPASIGADTYPLHETRHSMHVAAGGGMLHATSFPPRLLQPAPVVGADECFFAREVGVRGCGG